ncbi:MAG: hypothetical protein ACO1N7_00085 [Sphingobacteriaceae bacterium]
MENSKGNNKGIKRGEDEISAEAGDFHERTKPADDSFKTSPRKHRLGWETPLDEQMHDDNKLSATDEEGD